MNTNRMIRTEINIDFCFWGLPVCLRWNIGQEPSNYIALHILCLEIITEW